MGTNRIRVLLVGLLAVFAVNAVASASASAHTFVVCKETGTETYETNACANKVTGGKFSFAELTTGTEKAEGTSGMSKLESELGGKRVIIECATGEFAGELEKEGKSKAATITYKTCKLFQVVKRVKSEVTGCTVPNIRTAALKDLLITGKGIGPEDEFEPESGTTFVKVKLEGASCALASEETFTGKLICQLPEATAGKVRHELVCSSGDEFKFGVKAASYFSTEAVKLSNGASWAAE
jgi:hypothetical protein